MYETYNKDTYKFCIVQITLFMMGLSDVISEKFNLLGTCRVKKHSKYLTTPCRHQGGEEV
jgi:hypothetical protein